MIVLDASAVLELILETEFGRLVADRIEDPSLALHVPHLLDIEVAHALRRLVRERVIAPTIATRALDRLRDLDLDRHEHDSLLDRIWALRDNLGAYDAVYVALAEVLSARLVTCDAKMARTPGVSRRVELID